METALWLVGVIAGILLLAFAYYKFEDRFGTGTGKDFLIGLGACGAGLALAILFLATQAETIEMGSHKYDKLVKIDRNMFHQVTSRSTIAISKINEIATEEDVSYTRGRRHVTQRLVLKGDDEKFYPMSGSKSLKERFTELEAFLNNPEAPDYYEEESGYGAIAMLGGIPFLVGLFFLRKAFFSGGEFGEMKRNMLKVIKNQPATTELHKYELIGTMFVLTAAALIDKIFQDKNLPLASLRGSASQFGGGFFGMGKITNKEIQLLLAESCIFLYYWLEKLAAPGESDASNLLFLRTIMFEKVVLSRFESKNSDIQEIAKARLEKYQDSERGAKALDSPEFWFVEYINYVMLYKKLKRVESVPGAFRANISGLQSCEFYRVYRVCMEALLREDIQTLSAYEAGAIMKEAISKMSRRDRYEGSVTITESVSDEELVGASSSVGRALAKRR